ncbi:MAG: CDP-alcohol phosphatidyltransferase family protein [Mariprofundaceae bacterium]|nr:CDP-alcohol phosphatidyltransferase family protein [Mariprofundaceae bacterium]
MAAQLHYNNIYTKTIHMKINGHLIIPVLDDEKYMWALAHVGGIPVIRRMALEEARKGVEQITVLVRKKDEELDRALSGTPAEVVVLAASEGVDDAVRKLGDTGDVTIRGISVHDENGRKQLENKLLAGLVKDTEGVMSRLVNRRISLAVTRRLMNRSVTPNQMTWVSMGIGLLGALFFLPPGQIAQIVGALLFLLHSILDGCDGELARLKFQESRFGGIFDYWSDNIVHVAVFTCIGIGWTQHGGGSYALLSSLLAVGGTVMSAWLVFEHTMRDRKGGGPLYTSVSTENGKSMLVRIVDLLSRRDFIYLVVLLALFGKIHWFLVMTAVGAPIYAIVLLVVIDRDKRRRTT